MRTITYSQGVCIDDPGLVATLAIFCGKTWLPYDRVGDTMQKVLEESGALPEAAVSLRNDPARNAIHNWDESYDVLYEEQVFERLPGPSAVDHSTHRDAFDRKTIDEIAGAQKGIYERLALRFHYMRGDLPGIEMLDAGDAHGEVDLARSVIFLDLPKLKRVEPTRLLDLRADAKAHGLDQFWDMIENEYRKARAQGQPNFARAEEIRREFVEWNRGLSGIRGLIAGTAFVTTLAVYCWGPTGMASPAEGILLGAAASTIPAWFSELNKRLVTYRRQDRQAFTCLSRIDRKLRMP